MITILKHLAWLLALMCVAVTDASAALSGWPLTEWNRSMEPMVYASQPTRELYSDVFRAWEEAKFTLTSNSQGVKSALSPGKDARAVEGRRAKTSVVMAPVISGQSQDQSVFQGGFASFWVTATGTEPMTYQWFKDGAPIAGANSSTFTLSNAQATDAGQYSATVRNSAGSAGTFPSTLTVNTPSTPPIISSQPKDQTVAAGGVASFSVSASGPEPLTYQWLKNGFTIPGETSSTLTLHNVQATDEGQYSVVVRNTDGPVTSNPATLHVLVSMAPVFDSPMWSQTNGFTATLHGQSQTSYRIQMSTNLVDWLDLPNAGASGALTKIQDSDATNAPQRFYRAVVSSTVNGR